MKDDSVSQRGIHSPRTTNTLLTIVSYTPFINTQLAAKRLAKYWNKRIELFGPEKAFLPMTQDGALKDDEVALSLGFARLMPSKDPSGRSIVFVDPSKLDSSKYERESMCRALWYILHASLENAQAQQYGNIMLGYPRNAKLTQVDRTLMKMNMECIRGCIPVRISALFLCQPPTFFAVIFPLIRLFLGERLRKRINVVSGSDEEVVEELAKFGLTRDCIPADLSGNVVLDHESWLEERKASDL